MHKDEDERGFDEGGIREEMNHGDMSPTSDSKQLASSNSTGLIHTDCTKTATSTATAIATATSTSMPTMMVFASHTQVL